MHLIVYLHGFKSSPQSSKAALTKQAVLNLQEEGQDLEWFCPQLPPSPKEAIASVCEVDRLLILSDNELLFIVVLLYI